MKWKKWHIDDLPDPGEKVLIWYKSGFHGCIEFFATKEAKESYIKGMKYILEGENYLQDPIILWMSFPKPPDE